MGNLRIYALTICGALAYGLQGQNAAQIPLASIYSGYHAIPENQQVYFGEWKLLLQKIAGDKRIDWKIYSQLTDELGQIHYRAGQYFQGIPVENGAIVIHTFQNKIIAWNGEIIPAENISGNAQISEAAALEKALQFVPANTYYWQDESLNQLLREMTGKQDTSYFPKAVKIYAAENLNYKNRSYLCYKFNIYAAEPLAGKAVFVNAENGAIVAAEDLILHTDVKGVASTAFSGSRPITTDSTAPGNYRLREKARGKGIETYNMKTGTSYGAAVDFTDADNVWNNVNTAMDEVATDAHWGAEKTYDYFDTILNRKSFDNNNAKIISYVHYSSFYSNAFWNGSYMTYGDGNGSSWKPLTSLDVCGHEISHAVTTYTAGLIYSYESGALNESFSDIFGNAIEKWARPKKHSWKIGEDFTTSGNGIRDMSNPNPYNHPKYYKGNRWYSGTGDNGGVHTNSGVQNYWFYLIADGISGTNEKGDVFDIDSLGVLDASRIAYRNLSVYLTKNSQYADARVYSILAAADLFGNCSKHVIAVTNAWWACGVGAKYDSGYVKANFTADTLVCSTSKVVQFKNASENSLSCKWYFGDGNTSAVFNPQHYYSAYGSYDVKLVAYSCFKNKSDSITRKAYVVVDSTFDICNGVLMPESGTDSVTKCFGFIYDDGGEGDYGALRQTNLKVNIPGANTIRFRFLVMDYENGYDSLVLFKNSTTQANKIGRFTGQTLPYGGAWQTVTANALWLRHYSDPFVEGKGFKIEFEGIRNALSLDLGADTTICFDDSVTLHAQAGGGYPADYRILWSTGNSGKSITLKPVGNTKYFATLRDACTNLSVEDSISVFSREPLDVALRNDTIICSGNGVFLQTIVKGGVASAYQYEWSPDMGNVSSQLVKPAQSVVYRVVLNDGCTDRPDTAYQKITVKPALKVQLSASDTLDCIGRPIQLTATPSGGDTAGYVLDWNMGLGKGLVKTVSLTDTALYKVTLTDGCSVASFSDSITIFTFPALSVSANADTLICNGSSLNIAADASGGKGQGYSFLWSNGAQSAAFTETPIQNGRYKVTLSDGCSPDVVDSFEVTLMAPLALDKAEDTTLCDGQVLALNFGATGGRASSRTITWNAGVSGYNVLLDPPAGLTQYVAVLSDGCTAKNDTTAFAINKLTPLSVSIQVSPGAICAGDSIKMDFIFSGGRSSTYTWFLDGIPVLFQSQKLQPKSATGYGLELRDGCSINASATASVSISPAAVAALSAAPKMVCDGDPISFQYNSPDASEVKWYFSNGDSAIGTGINLSYTFKNAGKYTAMTKVITSNSCVGIFDLQDTVTTVAYPKAGFAAQPNPATIENATILFVDQSTGATNYAWNFGDGGTSFQTGSASHTYTDTGRFKVEMLVSVAPGCADSASEWVRIKDVYHFYKPDAFTPDGNNVNDIYLPAGRGILSYQMQIYNRWGMKVFETSDIQRGWDGKDDNGTPWPAGMYVVKIKIIDTENIVHVEEGVISLLK